MAWNPPARSLTEPFEKRRYVHLVRLVVAGQHVHDEIDPKAQRHLALRLAARHDGIARPALAVDGPGAGPVITADNDAGNAIIDPVFDRLDPDLAGVPAAGKLVQQVEGFRQHVVRRDRHQRRDLDPGDERSEEHTLNSSHVEISYAVFCLKKKKNTRTINKNIKKQKQQQKNTKHKHRK